MCWRKDLNSMQERMEMVMNINIPDISHDVVFLVGKEKVEITCHKIFLAIASPVFEAMFSQRHRLPIKVSNDKELSGLETVNFDLCSEILINQQSVNKTNEKSNEVTITDLHPAGLKNIIKYAYTGKLDVDVKDAVVTMYAADKYDIPELTQHCSKVLNSDLSSENVVTIYQAAVLLSDTSLEERAWTFIERHSGSLLDSEQFLEFSENNLGKFLKQDYTTNGKSELDIFNATLGWGINQCDRKGQEATKENIKVMLKNVISFIRFPMIEPDEFSDFVEPSKILSDKDCIKIFKYFTYSNEKRMSMSDIMKYSCVRRIELLDVTFCSTAKNDILDIYTSHGYDSFTVTGNTNTLKLKCVGIVLPPTFNCSALTNPDIYLTVCVHQYANGVYRSITKKVSKFSEIFYIEFDSGVSIKPNQSCNVWVNLENGSGVHHPVSVVKFSSGLMKTTSITWNTIDKEELTLTFNPSNYVIWSLRFEY